MKIMKASWLDNYADRWATLYGDCSECMLIFSPFLSLSIVDSAVVLELQNIRDML